MTKSMKICKKMMPNWMGTRIGLTKRDWTQENSKISTKDQIFKLQQNCLLNEEDEVKQEWNWDGMNERRMEFILGSWEKLERFVSKVLCVQNEIHFWVPIYTRLGLRKNWQNGKSVHFQWIYSWNAWLLPKLSGKTKTSSEVLMKYQIYPQGHFCQNVWSFNVKFQDKG